MTILELDSKPEKDSLCMYHTSFLPNLSEILRVLSGSSFSVREFCSIRDIIVCRAVEDNLGVPESVLIAKLKDVCLY